ncbi:hypothetical protein [Longirhabdus pacifica]|uniref:hypothetical protein n=1 Tax=Longirhabdus pacifica TaxID=2305227 RepID=UPI001008785B|nr:hypothetical protein [Longirhabdus pacifica]
MTIRTLKYKPVKKEAKKVICLQNKTGLNLLLPDNMEVPVTIFESLNGLGRRGMITVNNLNSEGEDIELTFQKVDGTVPPPILLKTGANTVSFENIKRIKLRNTSEVLTNVLLDICVLVEQGLLCTLSDTELSTTSLPFDSERMLFESIVKRGEEGNISIELEDEDVHLLCSFETALGTRIEREITATSTFYFEHVKKISVTLLEDQDRSVGYAICTVLSYPHRYHDQN